MRRLDAKEAQDLTPCGGSIGVSVLVAGKEFRATQQTPLAFGRSESSNVVGLDAGDMGISSLACSVEFRSAVWWVVNQSTKRPLFIEHPGRPSRQLLPPGQRCAVTTKHVSVLIPGVNSTHVLEIEVRADYVAGLNESIGQRTSGTLHGANVTFSVLERDALAGLCAGYLESFPRRRDHPNTYEQAASLLGDGSWTAYRVRKAVERVKSRYKEHGFYFEGPQGNHDLADHLVSAGIISEADLGRLPGRLR